MEKPSEERTGVIRYSLLIVGVVAILGLAVMGLELIHDRHLPANSGPVPLDQVATNAIAFLAVLVSSLLVLLTYSLFRETRAALRVAEREAEHSKSQADSSQRQAVVAEQSLSHLLHDLEQREAAEQRSANPFLDIDKEGIGIKALERNVVGTNEDGEPILVGTRSGDDNDAYAGSILYPLRRFEIQIPIVNRGSGPALDVAITVRPISWARSVAPVFDGRLVFDQIRNGVNLTLRPRESKSLFLASGDTLIASLVLDRGDFFPNRDAERGSPVRLDVIELAMRRTDAEEETILTLLRKIDSLATKHDQDGFPLQEVREIDAVSRSFAQRAHSMPIGVRVEVSYRNIFANGTSPEAPDRVVYNLLLSEHCEPGLRSSVTIDDHLEYLSNKVLGATRSTTICRRMIGEILPTLRPAEGFYLMYEAGHRFQPYSEDQESWKAGVPFAGIQVEAEASERIRQYSSVVNLEPEPQSRATAEYLWRTGCATVAFGIDPDSLGAYASIMKRRDRLWEVS